MDDPDLVLRKYPETNQTPAALYARAYAWHRGAYPERAVQEIDRLVATAPHDPYLLELKGRSCSSRASRCWPSRRCAKRCASGSNPLISSTLGHALVASDDPANLAEASKVLKVAVQRDNENPFAWYNLGLVYTKLGDEPRARIGDGREI
jgi:predicted Zn-dependent protease